MDCSDDDIDAFKEQPQQPIPNHVTKKLIEDLRQDLYEGFKY